MNGILYFSSTGNSLYAAQVVQKCISGELRYIPRYKGDGSEYEKIIIVTPVYSYGLPVHVFDLLPSLRGRVVYMILTYGGMLAGADRLAYEYAEEHGLNVKGVYAVKMPENFTLTFSTPAFYNKLILYAAPAKIEKIAAGIDNNEQNIPKAKKTRRLKHETNKANWHMIAADFSVTEDCISCRKCVNLCPTGNITMKDGKVQFGEECVACLGCYHRCPRKAIRYKNRKKLDRYFHPEVKESDLGEDVLIEGDIN
jgi:Fe-S-cluster-containing hydrogenase component 2